MNDSAGPPLTNFLIQLSHDVERLKSFSDDPEQFLRTEGSGLDQKHRDALIAGDLTSLLQYVREENPGKNTLLVVSPMAPINCPEP